MIFGDLDLWIIRALGDGYTMSYAGYGGLIRRWVSYPPYFQSFMDVISYFAMIMRISLAMYVIPVLFTLLGVGTNVFRVRSEAPSMPAGTNITMNTTDNSSSSKTVNTKTLNSSDKNLV
jgi:cytochrome aa3-600 menaquinol oxidase subunit 1